MLSARSLQRVPHLSLTLSISAHPDRVWSCGDGSVRRVPRCGRRSRIPRPPPGTFTDLQPNP
eukprot:3035225-Rhodomonas_salina.2